MVAAMDLAAMDVPTLLALIGSGAAAALCAFAMSHVFRLIKFMWNLRRCGER